MIKKELTQEYLYNILNYNKDTGIFTWNKRNNKSFNTNFYNKEAGTIGNHGYLAIKVLNKMYLAHRLAWFYIYRLWPDNDIDHINNNRLDNRIINLREATRKENQQNLKKCYSTNKSTGLLGSSFNKKREKYESHITINYIKYSLGFFDTAEDAHNVYLQVKREKHPFGEI